MKMKFALIFLSIFVAVSHQQHDYNPRMMFAFPWFDALFPNQPMFHNNYDALVSIYIINKLRACILLVAVPLGNNSATIKEP